ncbi:actin-related protein 10 [Contarinia nasturtii]|uniref:actin-related protein 10 n=1 Tax=Contarinia nasturtii TaxID=265458 RepID=UPI0012D3CC6E|nr:actin-related protein 10 [Contarinia nasturtii]
MPVYEIAPVVFDIGSAYTKLGFVAEPHPRSIVPTQIISGTSPTTSKPLFEYKNQLQLYDQVVDFVQTLFFKHLLVNPKERKVVIVESVLCPTEIREVFAKVLFRHFDISSILFVTSHLVALSTLAIETGLVVDIGHKEATVIPVYSGVQVLFAWQAQPLAAEAVHTEIKRQLIENGVSSELLTDDIIEEIKVRTCFVTTYERSQKYKNNEEVSPPPDVSYPIQGKETITIPGKLRETAYEVLFPEDNDRLGLPYIILDAIAACSLDMRKTLLENLVILGGTAMAQGLTARLKDELITLLKTGVYKEKLHTTTVKFHRLPAKENFAAWLGGSIYGGTEMLKAKGLAKETYMKLNRVPDWINLDDNRPWGN